MLPRCHQRCSFFFMPVLCVSCGELQRSCENSPIFGLDYIYFASIVAERPVVSGLAEGSAPVAALEKHRKRLLRKCTSYGSTARHSPPTPRLPPPLLYSLALEPCVPIAFPHPHPYSHTASPLTPPQQNTYTTPLTLALPARAITIVGTGIKQVAHSWPLHTQIPQKPHLQTAIC